MFKLKINIYICFIKKISKKFFCLFFILFMYNKLKNKLQHRYKLAFIKNCKRNNLVNLIYRIMK